MITGIVTSLTILAQENIFYKSKHNTNTFVIHCDSCNDTNKRHKIQNVAIKTLQTGSFQFIVFDKQRNNISLFEVKATNTINKTQQPNHIKVAKQQLAQNERLNKQFIELKEIINQIKKAAIKSHTKWLNIDVSSGYVSAYNALANLESFNHYLSNQINKNIDISDISTKNNLSLDFLSKHLHIEKALILEALSIDKIRTNAKVNFVDGTKITIYPSVKYDNDKQILATAETTRRAYSSFGTGLPKNQFDLKGYPHGGTGFNSDAFLQYFSSIGFNIVDANNLLGKENCHKTQWQCKDKTCALNQVSTK